MINTEMLVFSCYDYQKVKETAQKIKSCDLSAVVKAGFAMATRLKRAMGPHLKECILVPAPGRGGRAIYTDLVARTIGEELGIPVMDVVRGNERCSFCDLKKKKGVKIGGDYRSYFGFHADSCIPYTKKIVFVDNVKDTGLTLNHLEELFPENECIGLVYGEVNKTED